MPTPRSSLDLLAVHHGGGVGGAPVSLLKLLAGLPADDFRPRAVFTEAGPILDFARELGVSARVVATGGAFFYSAHARLAPRTLGRFLRTFPAAVRHAHGFLRREPPDLLHLNTSVLLAWAVAARRERIPVLWTVREVLGPNPTLRGWHARFIQRHAAQIVTISGSVRACFPPVAAVVVVHNAVDLNEFSPDLHGERAAVRAELGLDADAPTVMAVGSVQREKGHWLLLDALGQVATQVPSVRLVLVCGGVDASYAASWRGRVKRALGQPLDNLDALLRDAEARGLRDRIVVTGFRRDVARVLTAADVLAFPSIEPEGFGRPIIEAMAMRCPVVATDIGPSRELLGPEAGLLVPSRPSHLAQALLTVLRSPGLREQLGQAGRARVESCFTLDRQVARMAELYRATAAPVAAR